MADIYNVVRGDGVFFEGMTKEQIYELIAEMTGETVQDIDQAFITKLKEINKGNSIRLWVGTTAEYNALATKEEDVLYVCTDDTFVQDTGDEIKNIKEKIDANTITLQDWIQDMNKQFSDLKNGVMNMKGIKHYTAIAETDQYISAMNVGDMMYVYADGDWPYKSDLLFPTGTGYYWVYGENRWLDYEDSTYYQKVTKIEGKIYEGGSALKSGANRGLYNEPDPGGNWLIIRIG